MIIPLTSFTGLIPKLSPESLPDNAAQAASDVDFTGRDLRGLPANGVTGTVPTGSQYAYTDGQTLYVFLDKYTSMVRAPNPGDTYNRYYYSTTSGSGSAVKVAAGINVSNTEPTSPVLCGVPSPLDDTGGISALSATVKSDFVRDTTKGVTWAFTLVYEDSTGATLKEMAASGSNPTTDFYVTGSSTDSADLWFTFNVPAASAVGITVAAGVTVKPVVRLAGTKNGGEVFRIYTPNSSQTALNSVSLITGGVSAEWVQTTSTTYKMVLKLGPAEERNYVYTLVNKWGEESAPSKPFKSPIKVNFFQDVSLKLNWTSAQIAALSGYAQVDHIRVYRTQTGVDPATGAYSTDYQLCMSTEWTNADVESGTYSPSVPRSADSFPGMSSVAAGVYPSTGWTDAKQIGTDDSAYYRKVQALYALNTKATWTPWPSGVEGLVALANGVLAGFKGRDIYFSEPYIPSVAPKEYVMSVRWPIVALVPFGDGVMVLTKANTYYIAGTHPSQYAMHMMPEAYGAISRFAVAVIDGAVAYACSDGIALCDGASTTLRESQLFFTRFQWDTLKNMGDDLMFAYINGWIIIAVRGSTTTNNYAFKFDEFMNPVDGSVHAAALTGFAQAANWIGVVPALLFPGTKPGDSLWAITGTTLVQLFDAGGRKAFSWRSKEFLTPKPTNFGVVQLHGSGTFTVKVWADSVLKTTQTVTVPSASRVATMRLPGGFLATRWSIEVDGSAATLPATLPFIERLFIATTGEELRGV